MQPANSLPYWPGYGYSLSSACGSNLQPAQISLGIERQFARFEGVQRSVVRVTRNGDGSLDVNCQIEDSEGPLVFVMSATEAAAKLVSIMGEKVYG